MIGIRHIELNLEQYLVVIKNELEKQLNSIVKVTIVEDFIVKDFYIRVSHGDWTLTSHSLKKYWNGCVNVNEVVQYLVNEIRCDFGKQILADGTL